MCSTASFVFEDRRRKDDSLKGGGSNCKLSSQGNADDHSLEMKEIGWKVLEIRWLLVSVGERDGGR